MPGDARLRGVKLRYVKLSVLDGILEAAGFDK